MIKIPARTILPYFFDVVAYPVIQNQKFKEHIDTKGVMLWKEIMRRKMSDDDYFPLVSKLYGDLKAKL